MAPKLNRFDLALLRTFAYDEMKEFPARVKLPDQNRQLTLDELRIIAFLKASISLLKQKGIVKLADIESFIELVTPDSDALPED